MTTAVKLVCDDGSIIGLAVRRWMGDVPSEERRVLQRVIAPVLDIGCGPGRHVGLLSRRGIASLGLDVSPAALDLARSRGAFVLGRSVFERVPGTGRWMTALLLDGNIGIGGSPRALLARTRSLLRSGGRALVELAGPRERSRVVRARIESASTKSAFFPWAVLSVRDVRSVASASGFEVHASWEDDRRWFGELRAS